MKMSWSDSSLKLLNILEAITKELDVNVYYVREDKVIEVLDAFSVMKPVSVLPQLNISSGLFPVEAVKSYKIDVSEEVFVVGSGQLVDMLAERGYSVLSFDSSSFSSGPHLYVDLLIINVGYWYYNYANHIGGSNNKARIFGRIPEGVRIRIKIKEFELEVISEILSMLGGRKKFLFMDESLNALYTLSWAIREREKMIDLIKQILEVAKGNGYVPLGIFYTSATDIIKTLSALDMVHVDVEIRDRVIMDRFLEPLSRSPVFRVYSRALENSGLNIDAVYIKPNEGNIIRVEFPSEFRSNINDIHLVVLAQSVLGGGYPYALQKAHEMAVITSNEREIILSEICRRLSIPEPQYIYSKKQYYKRWPIE